MTVKRVPKVGDWVRLDFWDNFQEVVETNQNYFITLVDAGTPSSAYERTPDENWIFRDEETNEQSPLDTQVGGSHYKDMKIQPMEYSMANGLDACQHTIIKYVTRFRDKGGRDDLEKAKHCIDMLIGFEYNDQ